MGDIVPFNFDGNQVRVIVDLEGNPWWVAADVACILGYQSASTAARQHVRDHQKGLQELQTLRGAQRTLIINEGGLYRLIMRSDKPDAERFQDWVTDEVLPSIRRNGSYSVAPAVPKSFSEALQLAAAQQREIEAQAAQIAELEPAAQQFQKWQVSEDTVYVVEWAKSIGITQPKAYDALRALGVLFKQQHEGISFNVPKRGWEHCFDLVDEFLPGPRKWVKVCKITPVGQVELAELLIEHGWIAP